MDIFPLLDELRTIARNGLTYAQDPYDRERYARLLDLASQSYSGLLELPAEHVLRTLQQELGYITPKVGADAAIFDAQGRILLHQRADDHTWGLPCGWLEPNESPEEAVVREVREETGLHVRPWALVGVFTRKPSAQWGIYTAIAVVYLCEVTGGTLALSHEGIDLRYRPIETVTAWHGLHERYARAAHDLWQRRQRDPVE